MKRIVMMVMASIMLAGIVLAMGAVPAHAGENCKSYGIHFTYELPAGFWTAGGHTYHVLIHDTSWGWSIMTYEFRSSFAAPDYYGQVFMRIGGVSSSAGRVTQINASEDSVFQVSYNFDTNLAGAEAARTQVNIWFRWDNEGWVHAPVSRVMPWCEISPLSPNHWTRSWLSDY